MKYIIALVLGVAIVFLAGLLNLLADNALVYVLAAVSALLCVGLPAGDRKTGWIVAAVLVAVGAALSSMLEQSWGLYVMALGLGAVGGLLALMFFGPISPMSNVHDSKGNGH